MPSPDWREAVDEAASLAKQYKILGDALLDEAFACVVAEIRSNYKPNYSESLESWKAKQAEQGFAQYTGRKESGSEFSLDLRQPVRPRRTDLVRRPKGRRKNSAPPRRTRVEFY